MELSFSAVRVDALILSFELKGWEDRQILMQLSRMLVSYGVSVADPDAPSWTRRA